MRLRPAAALAIPAALAGLLAVHNVAVLPTEEDIAYGDRILAAAGYEGPKRDLGDIATFEGQIRAIRAVQDAVIRMAERDEEIPFDQEREPKNIVELRKGLCYDRARSIEKILAYIGLEVRHVSVYEARGAGPVSPVLTPGTRSHALSEVRTTKGWIAVDPNVRWIGLTADGTPRSVPGLRSTSSGSVVWDESNSGQPHPIFLEPFVFVRGLYSRHGRFFPPFTPIPDVNWRQLLQNFGD
jgi:hypothetical protein